GEQRKQRPTPSHSRKFRRQRLHQRRVRSRARFERNFRQPAQLWSRAFHREQRKTPAQSRHRCSRDRETRRTVAHQLQNRSSEQGRHLRGGRRNSASHGLQNA